MVRCLTVSSTHPCPSQKPAALDCLRTAAKSGASVEMSYAFLTTDGDPIRYWLRVSGGSAEMFEHSEDLFGAKGWKFFASCSIAVSELIVRPLTELCGEGSKL